MTTKTKASPKGRKASRPNGLKLKRVERVILFVRDFDRSVDYYTKTLAIPLKSKDDGWAEFDTQGATLCIHGGRQTTAGSYEPEISFRVDDLDATVQTLKAKGIEVGPVNSPCAGVRCTSFKDPEGNCIGLEGK